jgi:beta-galactosidase
MNPLLCLVLAVCAGLFTNLAAAGTRTSEPINRDWTFTLGDPPGAQTVDHDTAAWRRVDLPHSFSQPFFLGTGFYVGHGWYRKHLELPADVGASRSSSTACSRTPSSGSTGTRRDGMSAATPASASTSRHT